MQPEEPSASLPLLHADKELTLTTELTAARLRELLNYDPATGQFTRIAHHERDKRNRGIGAVVGSNHGLGYVEIGVNGGRFLAHRLAVLYVTGQWPTLQVDHVNGQRSDNRWANLRQVDNTTNIENRHRPNKNNRSGWLGCYREKRSGKWVAQITVMRKIIRLGLHSTPEAASSAYLEAKRRLHKGCTL
jgi:hypothetical protein